MDKPQTTKTLYVYKEILYRYADGSYTTGRFEIAETNNAGNGRWILIGSFDVALPVCEIKVKPDVMEMLNAKA